MKTIKVIQSISRQTFRVTLDGIDQIKEYPYTQEDKKEMYLKAKEIAFNLASNESEGVKIESVVM